jgi:hypothetical protein
VPDIYTSWDMPASLAVFVVAVTTGTLALGILAGFTRAVRRVALARAAERSVGDNPPALVESSDVVLTGVVRHLDDHTVAVKVSIDQHGAESESSGSWSYTWTEIDREIVVKPFVLELADKTRVRVDAPPNVDVADALDQKVWIDRNHRVLSAELVPGERIWARGRLERGPAVAASGYRDVAWGWVLVPTRGQMLLSSEPLGQGLRDRARFHRLVGVIGLVLLAATQLTFLRFYARYLGHTETGTVTNTRYYTTTDDDGDSEDHYEVDVTLHDGLADTFSIGAGDYDLAKRAPALPVRRASASNWELGSEATIGWWHGVPILFAPSAFLLLYRMARARSRPWFRRKLNESGSGHLPEPPPQPRILKS